MITDRKMVKKVHYDQIELFGIDNEGVDDFVSKVLSAKVELEQRNSPGEIYVVLISDYDEEYEGDGCSFYVRIKCVEERPETDKEMSRRISRAKRREEKKRAEEERERISYEKLKAKFG